MSIDSFDGFAALSSVDAGRFEALQLALTRAAVDGVVTIAYSGGLDSRFLAWAAKRLGFSVRLLHIAGEHIGAEETTAAQRHAQMLGVAVETVHIQGVAYENLAAAGRERCYVCKLALFSQLKNLARDGRLCDGSNASDSRVFRPGMKALRELGIYSPLAESGWEKADIRRVGTILGFPEPMQASRPCLLTRFPYGAVPTKRALETIARVEGFLKNSPGTAQLRVRLRYPVGIPELHVEEASLKGLSTDRVRELLLTHFGDELNGLEVIAMQTLSGFYDRT